MYKRKYADSNYTKLPKLSDLKFDRLVLKKSLDRIELLVRAVCSDLCKKRKDVEEYISIDYCNETEMQLKKMDIEVRTVFSSVLIAGSKNHAYCQVKIDDELYDFEPQDGDSCLNKSFYSDKTKIMEHYPTDYSKIIDLYNEEPKKETNKINFHDEKENILDSYSNHDISLPVAINRIMKLDNCQYEQAINSILTIFTGKEKEEKKYSNELNEIKELRRDYYLQTNTVTTTILRLFRKRENVLIIDIAKKTGINQNTVNIGIDILFDIGVVKINITEDGIKLVDFP